MKMKLSSIFLILVFFANFSNAAEQNICKLGYADLVAPLMPAVVNIRTSQKASNNPNKIFPLFPPGSPLEDFNQFFKKFGAQPQPLDEEDNSGSEEDDQTLRPYADGSGFIIDAAGFVVTNHHVVADAEKIVITMYDDKKYDAKLIGSDSRTDLALLKIDTKHSLPFVKFGSADETRVGDPIVAIGNPFGLGGTVTAGIISARSRDIHAGMTSLVDNFIQTDAAINKGNSGGPMFNMKGEVIGINAAIYSPSGGNVGIGFAVPSTLAEPIIEQIKNTGKVVRGWLGVTIQSTEGVAEGLGIKDNKGALVVAVIKDSPSDKSGISVGDIILSFDGKEIIGNFKLPKIVAETPVGKVVKVKLLSKGKTKIVSLKLEEFDDKKLNKAYGQKTPVSKQVVSGLGISDLTPDIRSKFQIRKSIDGIAILDIKRKSSAAKSGLRVGDVVIAMNQKQITDVENFIQNIEESKKQKLSSVMLWINRDGVDIFLQLPIK